MAETYVPPVDLSGMKEDELAMHVAKALESRSGRVLKELLKTQCFMLPAAAPMKWERGQVEFRYGRMTLFQMLEHYEISGNKIRHNEE